MAVQFVHEGYFFNMNFSNFIKTCSARCFCDRSWQFIPHHDGPIHLHTDSVLGFVLTQQPVWYLR